MIIKEIQPKPVEARKLRVAAYARVSVDEDAAFHSLTAQMEYYEKYIPEHEGWELAGIYSDNGISGTIVDRPEFQRMLNDARAGKIDLIITKSITRFARNVLVLLETMRELKHLNIDIYFEKEQMHSISPDGELLLTLMAVYAEEEARSASENVRWKIKHRFEEGKPWVGWLYGYRMHNQQLVIVPKEAEVVKRIFQECLDGESFYDIAKGLNRDGVLPMRSDIWTRQTIVYILTNEKYKGDMLLQKTYREDFRTKKDLPNRGQVRQYYVEGSHEAIVSAEDFERVQQIMAGHRLSDEEKARRANDHGANLFRGLVICGQCGRHYSCHLKNNRVYWTCKVYWDYGKDACPSQPVPEDILICKTREVLGLAEEEELTRELLMSSIREIVVTEHHHLCYVLEDGSEREVEWQYPSRSRSWTPEMRQAASEKSRKWYQEHKKQQTKPNNAPRLKGDE